MEIQVKGSLSIKESEVFGGLSFDLYKVYAYHSGKADMFLGKDFLSRILDAYYYVGGYDNHVIYSDSDGKKVITFDYEDYSYKVTVRKRDIPDIINYLRDEYSFFYDPNRKESSTNDKYYLNKLVNLRLSILQVYREIFDCSNGDPEGTDMENLQDILTEYQRVLKMKDDAETDNVKWRPYIADILGMDKGSDWSDICIRARLIKHDKDIVSSVLKLLRNDIREAYKEVFPADADDKHWFAYDRQAVTDITEALKRERAIKEKAEEKAVRYKEELRSVNESFEYQTSELCKILGLDAGSPPEDILEAVEDIIRYKNEAQKIAGTRMMDIGKLCEDLTEERERANKLEQKLMAVYDVLGVVPKEDI